MNNFILFSCSKAFEISNRNQRLQPYLTLIITFFNMNMSGLIIFVAIKEKPIAVYSKNCRHLYKFNIKYLKFIQMRPTRKQLNHTKISKSLNLLPNNL